MKINVGDRALTGVMCVVHAASSVPLRKSGFFCFFLQKTESTFKVKPSGITLCLCVLGFFANPAAILRTVRPVWVPDASSFDLTIARFLNPLTALQRLSRFSQRTACRPLSFTLNFTLTLPSVNFNLRK